MIMAKSKEQETPEGYKQTEIGVIPEDWALVTYDEAFKFLRTASYSRDQLGIGTTIYIHYGDIHTKWNHFVDLNEDLPTIEDEKVNSYSLIEDGDLIVADASEDYEGVCKSVEVRNKNSIKAISGLHTFLLRDKANYFAEGFKGYIHCNSLVKARMDKLATGLKVYGVSKSNLKLIKIPQPPLPEQNAIISVLSGIDRLIAKQEKLIKKKKNIKKGVMQELLTGKRRLPGFEKKHGYKQTEIGVIPNDWSVETVNDFGEVVTGGTPPTKVKVYWNGEIPWVTPTDITRKKDIFHTEREITKSGLNVIRKLPSPSLLITCIASIGKNAILRNDGACNQQINAVIPNKEHNVDFLYYFFENAKQYLLAHAGITATNIISKQEFSVIQFGVPKLPEQTAIANVLCDIDSEIELLESQLEKYKNIKQGTMQNLLTGKIRLIKK